MEIYRVYLFAMAILGLVIFVYFGFFVLSLLRITKRKPKKKSDEAMTCHIPAWRLASKNVDISDIPESAEDLLNQ